MDIKDIASKIKKPTEEPAKLVEEKGSPDSDIGQAFLKLLPAFAGYALAGVEGGKAVTKGLETQAALDEKAKAEAKQNEAMATAAAKDARKEAREEEKLDLERKKVGADLARQKNEFKPNQYSAATFARRLEQAEDNFKALNQAGYNRADKSSSLGALLPGVLKSGMAKGQEQAERNFVNSVLRRESGAAISPAEFANAEQQYFPRVGDTPEVLAQKEANRQIALQGLRAEAGGALGLIPAAPPVSYGQKKSSGMSTVPSANAAQPMKPPKEMSVEELKAEIAQRRGK